MGKYIGTNGLYPTNYLYYVEEKVAPCVTESLKYYCARSNQRTDIIAVESANITV